MSAGPDPASEAGQPPSDGPSAPADVRPGQADTTTPEGTRAEVPEGPHGADITWSAVGSLLSGPLVWGGVGWGLDRVLGTRPICLVIGLLLGGSLGFWIVYSRFGRDQS